MRGDNSSRPLGQRIVSLHHPFELPVDLFNILLKRFAIEIFIISDNCIRVFYLVCFALEIFSNNEPCEMIENRSGYFTRGAFVLVTVDKYVVSKCCCSACYSRRKCYLWHEVMIDYYFKKLIDVCCF